MLFTFLAILIYMFVGLFTVVAIDAMTGYKTNKIPCVLMGMIWPLTITSCLIGGIIIGLFNLVKLIFNKNKE